MSKIEINEELREAVCAAVQVALGTALDCTRVWSAWSYGTMRQDDFVLVADDASRVEEIADAAIKELTDNAVAGTGVNITALRALIADDSYAMTFQSMGQYRSALLKALAPNAELRGRPLADGPA